MGIGAPFVARHHPDKRRVPIERSGFPIQDAPFPSQSRGYSGGLPRGCLGSLDRSAFLRNLRSLIGSSPAANDETGRQRAPILYILIEAARAAPLFAR